MSSTEYDALLERIRAEYLEMPGMSLRLEQVARLCDIEPPSASSFLMHF